MFGPKRINHLRGEAHLKEAIGLVEDHVLDTGQAELVRGRGRVRVRARGTVVELRVRPKSSPTPNTLPEP